MRTRVSTCAVAFVIGVLVLWACDTSESVDVPGPMDVPSMTAVSQLTEAISLDRFVTDRYFARALGPAGCTRWVRQRENGWTDKRILSAAAPGGWYNILAERRTETGTLRRAEVTRAWTDVGARLDVSVSAVGGDRVQVGIRQNGKVQRADHPLDSSLGRQLLQLVERAEALDCHLHPGSEPVDGSEGRGRF